MQDNFTKLSELPSPVSNCICLVAVTFVCVCRMARAWMSSSHTFCLKPSLAVFSFVIYVSIQWHCLLPTQPPLLCSAPPLMVPRFSLRFLNVSGKQEPFWYPIVNMLMEFIFFCTAMCCDVYAARTAEYCQHRTSTSRNSASKTCICHRWENKHRYRGKHWEKQEN